MSATEGRNKGGWLERLLGRKRAPAAGAAKTGASAYEYQPEVASISFAEGVALLEARGHRIVRHGVDGYSPPVVEAIRAGLVREGVRLEEHPIDPARFERFRAQADYTARYPEYYGTRMVEKQLEHFVAFELLGLGPDDVFMDIASEDSPVPDIYARMTGTQAYWQDIQYEPGVNGRRIGGDACAMPVPDGFASAVTLTCSLEHFERDADQRLCDELVRVVRPGGRFVIAPLYLFTEPAAMTDPVYSAQADVPFDEGVALYCAEGWKNRHGRFYSPQTLRRRVLNRLGGAFDLTMKSITNWQFTPEQTYLRFALYGRRV